MKFKHSGIPMTTSISLRNKKILNLVQEKGPLTLAEIQKEIYGVSSSTVGVEVAYLCKIGYLEEIKVILYLSLFSFIFLILGPNSGTAPSSYMFLDGAGRTKY